MPDDTTVRRRLAGVLTLCALVAVGCTPGGGGTADDTTAAPDEQATPAGEDDGDAAATAEATIPPTEAAEATEDVATVPDDAPTEPLATVEGTILGVGDPLDATLEILDLRRGGEVVTLAFAIVTGEGESVQQGSGCPFAAEVDTVSSAPGDRCRSISGTSLVDTVNGNRHLVLREPDGACVCTSNIPNFIEPGQRYSMGASFAAPPDDVDMMTVAVPQFAPVDVPLR